MKEQINKIMETEGMTPAKFADEIGVQRSSISHILSGRNKPSYDFIIKILERFQGINAEWLMTGKGSMIKSSGSFTGTNIKQASLFDQQLKMSEGKEKTSNEKASSSKAESINQNPKTFENKIDDTDISSDTKKTNTKQFTNVNNINLVVIFYSDGTFERYTSR
jgi:transcriptional regulator with XRE-family HTH domain